MANLINRLLTRPGLILVITLLISALFFQQMKSNVRMETDLDEYMPKDHPAFVYSDQAEDIYNIKDGIIFAVEAEESIYNSETLDKLKSLSKALMQMPEIEKSDVTSLYTADNIIGTDGSLKVNAFYKRVPTTEEKLAQLRRDVESNEMVHGRLVSEDGRTALIIARINDDVFDDEFYQSLLSLADEYRGPEKVYIAGSPIVEGTLAKLMPRDMAKMVPLVIGVIFIVLFLLLRRFTASLLILLSVLFASIWTFGLMGLFKIPLYSVSTMIPVMLIAIGVAYGIHLLNNYELIRRQNPDLTKNEAVFAMIEHMSSPVTMAAVTTMVGFMSLLSSQVYPIKYFGLFTAFGVLVELILSLLFISAGIILFEKDKPAMAKKIIAEEGESEEKSGWIHRYNEYLASHRSLVLMISLGVVLLSIWGSSKIWIDSSFLDKFEKSSDIVRTDAFINRHFGGTSTLNVILEGPDGVMKSPQALKIMARVQASAEAENPLVGSSFSLADYLKRMNKVMHEDRPEFERIPDDPDLIAQYLLLYEMSGDPENLWKVVDYNYAGANITIQLKSDNSKALESAMVSIDEYRHKLSELGISLNYAGSGYKAYIFTDLILEGQIMSLALSIVIVIILLSLMFRNIWIGIMGATPILLTSMVSFGIMGFLNIPLSTTTALISSIAVGIGIDYAVHFINTFRSNHKRSSDLSLISLRTMGSSGRAILYNALVVIAGFMVLLASVFPPNRTLGALISLNMAVSFIGTMTLLYVLLRPYYEKMKG